MQLEEKNAVYVTAAQRAPHVKNSRNQQSRERERSGKVSKEQWVTHKSPLNANVCPVALEAEETLVDRRLGGALLFFLEMFIHITWAIL